MQVESALIITSNEKIFAYIAEFLSAFSVEDVVHTRFAGSARRIMLEREFDYVFINAPLRDESGEALARQIAVKGLSQVILIVKSEVFEQATSVCERDGVLLVSKPMSKDIFRQAISLAKSMRSKLLKVRAEDEGLQNKIAAIRINDRAKSILIKKRGMSEAEAHRFIEKTAMDTRSSKRAVSERIINEEQC